MPTRTDAVLRRPRGEAARAKESGMLRMVRVLEAFSSRHPTLTPAEIARRSGIPVSTTYRLVRELVEMGMLVRSAAGVSIGLRLWELAARASPVASLRRAALPHMEDLQRQVRTHCQLAVLDGVDVVYIERLSSSTTSITNVADVAERMPALLCSAGLVIVAFASPRVQADLLAAPPPTMTRMTPRTADAYPAMLADVRRTGYASLDGWIRNGVTGVSVPVRDREGAVVAALNMLLDQPAAVPAQLPSLQLAAARISRSLGWSPAAVVTRR